MDYTKCLISTPIPGVNADPPLTFRAVASFGGGGENCTGMSA